MAKSTRARGRPVTEGLWTLRDGRRVMWADNGETTAGWPDSRRQPPAVTITYDCSGIWNRKRPTGWSDGSGRKGIDSVEHIIDNGKTKAR